METTLRKIVKGVGDEMSSEETKKKERKKEKEKKITLVEKKVGDKAGKEEKEKKGGKEEKEGKPKTKGKSLERTTKIIIEEEIKLLISKEGNKTGKQEKEEKGGKEEKEEKEEKTKTKGKSLERTTKIIIEEERKEVRKTERILEMMMKRKAEIIKVWMPQLTTSFGALTFH